VVSEAGGRGSTGLPDSGRGLEDGGELAEQLVDVRALDDERGRQRDDVAR